jgi:seryl-tRNA synthetase
MLTLKLIQDNRQEVIDRLKIKGFDASALMGEIIALDNKRKTTQLESDALQSEMNGLSKAIGQLIKDGQVAEANAAKEKTVSLKEQIKELTTCAGTYRKGVAKSG